MNKWLLNPVHWLVTLQSMRSASAAQSGICPDARPCGWLLFWPFDCFARLPTTCGVFLTTNRTTNSSCSSRCWFLRPRRSRALYYTPDRTVSSSVSSNEYQVRAYILCIPLCPGTLLAFSSLTNSELHHGTLYAGTWAVEQGWRDYPLVLPSTIDEKFAVTTVVEIC